MGTNGIAAPTAEHWPPLPGDYRVISYGAPVAVCTLASLGLVGDIDARAPRSIAVVGSLNTENLGIERMILNILASPHVRFLILCGEDTRQAVGHLPGRTLLAMVEHGVDDSGRIINAPGRRPELRNIRPEHVAAFREQVEVVDLLGEESAEVVIARADELAKRNPGIFGVASNHRPVPRPAGRPRKLVPDPAGFLVVHPDRARNLLVLEHYNNEGLLSDIIEGPEPSWLYVEAVNRGYLSRMDHAAYLGVELARAEFCLKTGNQFVQDRAPGELDEG